MNHSLDAPFGECVSVNVVSLHLHWKKAHVLHKSRFRRCTRELFRIVKEMSMHSKTVTGPECLLDCSQHLVFEAVYFPPKHGRGFSVWLFFLPFCLILRLNITADHLGKHFSLSIDFLTVIFIKHVDDGVVLSGGGWVGI